MPPVLAVIATAIVGAVISTGIGLVAQSLFAPSRKPVGSVATARPERARSGLSGRSRPSDPLAVEAEPGGPQLGVFGRRRVGGRVVLSAKSDVDRKTYLAIAMAGAPVTAINAVFINNLPVAINASGFVTSSPWATGNSINVKLYDGTQTVTDAELEAAFPGWTADHVGQGCAYARIIIDPSGNASAFSSGVPDFTFDVEGFKVYDPRDEVQDIDDPATWTFSENAALINAAYLVHVLGKAEPMASVDWASVAAAADVCDETVDTVDGGSEPRYRCAVHWRTDERHEDVLDRIGAAHAGGAFLIGKTWRMATGVYGAVSATITPDDYVSGGLEWSDYKPLSELVNGVRGVFASPLHHYEPRDFPAYQDAAALAEDGRELWLDLDYSTVTSAAQAQRLARIAYNKARRGSPASVQLSFAHFDTVADDIVALTDDLAGFTAKTFRVVSDELGEEFTVTLELEHEASDFYDWTAATDEKLFEQYPALQGGGSSGGTGYSSFFDPNALVAGGGTMFEGPEGSDPQTIKPRVALWASPSTGTLRYYVEFRVKLVSFTTETENALSGNVTGSVNVQVGPRNIPEIAPRELRVRMYTKRTATGETTAWRTLANIQKADTNSGAQALYDDVNGTTEANSPYYGLPGAGTPQVTASGGGSITVNVPQATGGKSTHLELWVNNTADPGTATLVGNAANGAGGANFNYTFTPGTSRYFWGYAKNNTDNKYGPVSSVLLVVFS